MENSRYIYTIAGMLFVTFLPRFLPLVFLSNKDLPDKVIKWLSFIPAAVLSALLAPAVLLNEGRLYLSLENTALLAFVPTLILAYKSKNIFYTVSGGLIFYLILDFIF
ncbi:MAG: AzlD domain-containing protein [Halanaerobium sp.]